jgi:hypothetical protein
MRKIQLLLVILFISSTASFAQLEKNQLYTGFSLTRGFGNGSTAYEFQPSASIALGKHSLLSLYGRYQHGKEYINPYFPDRTGRGSEYGIGVSYTYLRNFKGSKKWGWFLDASASVNRISQYDIKSGITESIYQHTEKQLLIKPGIFFKVSPRVMLFADFGNVRLIGDQNTNSFGNVINIGVKINLGKLREKK